MSALPSSPFWMVYGIGQGAPTVQHDSAETAKAEARRLARAHPGIPFVVLETIGAVVKDDMKTITFRSPDHAGRRLSAHDDIPF